MTETLFTNQIYDLEFIQISTYLKNMYDITYVDLLFLLCRQRRYQNSNSFFNHLLRKLISSFHCIILCSKYYSKYYIFDEINIIANKGNKLTLALTYLQQYNQFYIVEKNKHT